MGDEPEGYQVYLLRLWRVLYHGKWQWRASLQSPKTEERQPFANLDELTDYLNANFPTCQSAADPQQAPPAGEPEASGIGR